MRLLLDANLSPARIGAVLAGQGHDVLSLAADASLSMLADPQVLELAVVERRLLVTRNSKDFAPLLRGWMEAGGHHSGCILIWTLQHHEFGRIIEAVSGLLAERPEPSDWEDLVLAL
ncbi:MAG: DUF5615 family PIN-like protein [Chloroflexi bacterium]|nr:DUF5615 family PIN-like protein [Chloroflexota bacterium]